MQSFKYEDKVIDFRCISGEVLDSQKSDKTYISSKGRKVPTGLYKFSGPGTSQSVGDADQYYTSIDTTVKTKHDFWIKTDDAKEILFRLIDEDIPLRVGQRVSVVSVVEGERSYDVMLVNHNVRIKWYMGKMDKLVKLVKFWFDPTPVTDDAITHNVLYFMIGSLAIALLIFLGWQPSLAVVGMGIVYWFIQSGVMEEKKKEQEQERKNKISKARKLLQEHLDKQIELLLEKG